MCRKGFQNFCCQVGRVTVGFLVLVATVGLFLAVYLWGRSDGLTEGKASNCVTGVNHQEFCADDVYLLLTDVSRFQGQIEVLERDITFDSHWDAATEFKVQTLEAELAIWVAKWEDMRDRAVVSDMDRAEAIYELEELQKDYDELKGIIADAVAATSP